MVIEREMHGRWVRVDMRGDIAGVLGLYAWVEHLVRSLRLAEDDTVRLKGVWTSKDGDLVGVQFEGALSVLLADLFAAIAQ